MNSSLMKVVPGGLLFLAIFEISAAQEPAVYTPDKIAIAHNTEVMEACTDKVNWTGATAVANAPTTIGLPRTEYQKLVDCSGIAHVKDHFEKISPTAGEGDEYLSKDKEKEISLPSSSGPLSNSRLVSTSWSRDPTTGGEALRAQFQDAGKILAISAKGKLVNGHWDPTADSFIMGKETIVPTPPYDN